MDQEPAVETPRVEREVALDLVKRGLIVAPVIVAVCGLIRGWDGALSALIALAIVLVNFLAAAAGGYIVRLAVILVALVLLRHQPWIDLPMLGIVLVGTHIGLLTWEAKYVSLTLAAPGLRPARPSGDQ